jgi:ribosomal protein S17E
MSTDELINAIKALTFNCIDTTIKTKEDDVLKEVFEHQVKKDGVEMLYRYKNNFESSFAYLNTEVARAALDAYYANYQCYDRWHLAAHYAIMGRIVRDIIENKVIYITLEAFDHNTDCMKDKSNVKNIRKALEQRML